MTAEEIAVKLENHTHEIGSLKHRMNAAEEASRALNRLATAMEVMVTKQEAMGQKAQRICLNHFSDSFYGKKDTFP